MTRLDTEGAALVAGLLPYQVNVIEIDPSELPMDVEVTSPQVRVAPQARSGVLLDFGIRRSQGALVQLVLPDGQPVPLGARVEASTVAGPVRAVVARRGEVYLTQLPARSDAVVTWNDGQCKARIDVPAGAGDTPRIGPVACAWAIQS